MKHCNACDTTKDGTEFNVDNRLPSGLRYQCRSCEAALRKKRYALLTPEQRAHRRARENAWRAANPGRVKQASKLRYARHKDRLNAENRRRATGVTPEQYDAALASQKSRCSICGKHRSEQKRNLAADHCHTTGVFRGLLCDNCNHGLGKFKDSPELLARAISYLRDAATIGD